MAGSLTGGTQTEVQSWLYNQTIKTRNNACHQEHLLIPQELDPVSPIFTNNYFVLIQRTFREQ